MKFSDEIYGTVAAGRIAVQDAGRNAAFPVGLTDGQVLRIGRKRYDPSELGEK
jgi:ferric-dicitrate binding protein FerR (iron transport regulator)